MAEPTRYTAQNARAWDEIARGFPEADFFAAGKVTLSPREVEAVGGVAGRALLHLQCATGEDTLSWAILGARAVGVDISAEQIAIAREKASAAGRDARFVVADVLRLPPNLQREGFDVVYTGGGSLIWLPDLDAWARTVQAALRPGGRLVVHEEHPIAWCLESVDGQVRLAGDYFQRGRAQEAGRLGGRISRRSAPRSPSSSLSFRWAMWSRPWWKLGCASDLCVNSRPNATTVSPTMWRMRNGFLVRIC